MCRWLPLLLASLVVASNLAVADSSCVETCTATAGHRSGTITMWIGDPSNPGDCGAGCQFVPEVGMMFQIVGWGGGGEADGCGLSDDDCCLHAKLCDAWVNSVTYSANCNPSTQNETWCSTDNRPFGCIDDTTPWFEIAAARDDGFVTDYVPYLCGEEFEIVAVNSSSYPYCIEVESADCNSFAK